MCASICTHNTDTKSPNSEDLEAHAAVLATHDLVQDHKDGDVHLDESEVVAHGVHGALSALGRHEGVEDVRLVQIVFQKGFQLRYRARRV